MQIITRQQMAVLMDIVGDLLKVETRVGKYPNFILNSDEDNNIILSTELMFGSVGDFCIYTIMPDGDFYKG